MKLYTVISVVLCAALLTNADHLHEIRVLTSNCGDCGMAAFFGQLSVKVKYQCFLLFFSADILFGNMAKNTYLTLDIQVSLSIGLQ